MDSSVSCSVIIPVYNGARTLGRCLEALAAQVGAPPDLELVVVDDASTDGTVDVARVHGARVLELPTHQGSGAARNAGVAATHGQVLLFVDADCEPAPDWCQQMLRPLVAPDVWAVYGAYRTRQTAWVARLAQVEFDDRYARLAQRQNIDFLGTHAAAIRRSAFARVGGFRTDMREGEDMELGLRLCRQGGKMAFARQAVVYHEHRDTLWSYLRTKVLRGYGRTIIYAVHPNKVVADDYTPPWLKIQVVGTLAAMGMLVLSIVQPAFLSLFLLILGLLLLTTVPFTLFVARTQPDLMWITPLFSLGRSTALALGVIAGVVAVALGKHRDADTRRPEDARM